MAVAAKDVSVESYVEEFTEKQVSQPHRTSHIGLEEINQILDSLAEGSDDRSILQPKAHTRKCERYGEHPSVQIHLHKTERGTDRARRLLHGLRAEGVRQGLRPQA